MPYSFTRRARRLTVAGLATLGLAVVAQLAAAPAAMSADTYTVPLHQSTPITNSAYGDKGDCTGSPAQWGWHFVLPTDDAHFVTLTTNFQTAGTIVTTVFGPPTDKHAYVYTPTDDTLLSASAEVSGGEDEFFNLSHVCTGGGTTPSANPSETPSETPSATLSETPSETPTEAPSETPGATVLPTDLSATPTHSPTVEGVRHTRGPGTGAVGGTTLPTTGSKAPVGLLLVLGVGLVGAGVLTTAAGDRSLWYAGRHRA
jgi:hypothetical protein